MKHTIITSIIGLAMVASVSTLALAKDNFSILEGIQAEAMTAEEMDETQGKGCTPIGWTGGCSGLFSGMLQNINNSYGGYSQVFTGALTNGSLFKTARSSGDPYTTNYANATANNCSYSGTCGPAMPTNLTGTHIGSIVQAAGLDPRTGQYNGGGTQGYSTAPVQTYNPYAQFRYQQQMQQYQYRQAQAQAQANYRYNQGVQRTYGGLSLAGVKIGCGLAYCR